MAVQYGALAVVLGCALIAAQAGAEPKAYLPSLAGLALIALPARSSRRRTAWLILAGAAGVACITTVAAGWAFPLSKTETAHLLERQHPTDGPVRCVTPPRPGGYPEFGDQLVGRTYICGYKNLGAWNNRGGIKLGQGIGIEVDDTHVVRAYP